MAALTHPEWGTPRGAGQGTRSGVNRCTVHIARDECGLDPSPRACVVTAQFLLLLLLLLRMGAVL